MAVQNRNHRIEFMNRLMRLFLGLICLSVPLFAQNIDLYLALIQEGKLAQVKDDFPTLKEKHPNDPGVLYLEALMTTDGNKSVERFRDLVQNYPKSEFADEASLKIGEYLYSRGLYSQASIQCRSVPLQYPDSPHIQRAVNLMVKSYFATGEVDSARYYVGYVKRHFPDLDVSRYGLTGLDQVPKGEVNLVRVDPDEAQRKIAAAGVKKSTPDNNSIIFSPPKPKPWVVQVGAFGIYDNARRLERNLVSNGYDVIMDEVNSNGRRLHVVRVARYETREKADAVGRELREKFNLDYRVLKRPE